MAFLQNESAKLLFNYLHDLVFRKDLIVTLGITTSAIILIKITKNWFDKILYFKNVPGPIPWPIIGNFQNVLIKGFAENDTELIKKYGPILGYFEGSTPVLLTTDVQLLKNVLIKDFNCFADRRIIDSLAIKPADKFLTNLKEEEWKNARTIVTTAFSSGKLKLMSKHMKDCGKSLDSFLENVCQNDRILDLKTLFSGYTLDVISSCCFGVSINSVNESDNEFLSHLRKIFQVFSTVNLKIFFAFLFPKFCKFLVEKNIIQFFPGKSMDFFHQFFSMIIDRRKNNLEKREDFIQAILDHEESSTSFKKILSNEEIMAQSFLFLFAGYETTSQTLCFITYNLAMNPSYQEKLFDEIKTILDANGELNYDSVREMTFMDQVINETLRMFPATTRIDRVASRDYDYNGITIKKGTVVTVPIWTIHNDPKLYSNPNEFRPERFDQESWSKRESVSFMPFGSGPRNCVGMRFATLEIKLLLGLIISKYRFEKCEKSPEHIKLNGFGRPIDPIYVKISPR